jgi:hypothetical protein
MPLLVPDDVVRRQKVLVVSFGVGDGAIKVPRELVDTMYRWGAWLVLAGAAFPLLWKVVPLGVVAVALAWVLAGYAKQAGRQRVAVAAVVGVVLAVMAPISPLSPLPLVGAALVALVAGWFASGPVAAHVDADRPFRYWVAVLRAEAAAARPFPKES